MKTIDLFLEDGKQVEAEVIFTFEENGDEFILYEYEGNAYAAKLLPDDTLAELQEDEWELVNKIYKEYQSSIEKEDK